MTKLPILASAVRGGATISPVLTIVAGIAIVAVVGGVIYLRSRKRASHCKSCGSRTTSSVDASNHKINNTLGLTDWQIIERLDENFRKFFPDEMPADFRIKQEWLFGEVLLEKMNGDDCQCDVLLEKLIQVSEGAFVAAANIGDVFDCNCMHRSSELADDMRIKIVFRRGLIRVSTGEVLIDAEVA